MLPKAAAWPLARTVAGSSLRTWAARRAALAAAASSRPLSAAAASSPDRADADAPSASSPSTNPNNHYYTLDPDQRAFQQLARDFAREKLYPHSAEWDERSFFPVDAFREAASLGLAGLFVPEHLGGTGLSRLSAAVVFEALAEGDVPFSAYLSIHNMVAGAVAAHVDGDAERFAVDSNNNNNNNDHFLRRRTNLLARLCSMESFAAYCLTEPASGSDAASLATTATRAVCSITGASGWSLRGSKSFISGAGVADVYLVMARVVGDEDGRTKHDQNKDPAHGVTAFLVDRKRAEGGFSEGEPNQNLLTFGSLEKKMGWRMQPTAAVHLDGVFVPDEDVVGPLGQGFRAVALKALDGGRINIGACSVGGAQAALAAATQYSRERKQFGVRVADFQATKFRLADAATDVEAARLLVRRAAAALDMVGFGGGGDHDDDEHTNTSPSDQASALAAMAKRFASDKCFDAANAALQTFGGYGFLRDYGVERIVRDLRVHSLLEGTNEVMRLVVAKKLGMFAGGGGR
jgi:alkylation response protein AidB-like acyl-CoA dehydrogenase